LKISRNSKTGKKDSAIPLQRTTKHRITSVRWGCPFEGGDEGAFKRYMFFKNNPQYAVDYESIRSGNLSKYPTDGSSLVKTDLSTMDASTASYYKKNVGNLLMPQKDSAWIPPC
jgi:hypothetical protein